MTDIIDRLRFTQGVSIAGTPLDMPREDPLSLEAADEIERLRSEVKRMSDALEVASNTLADIQLQSSIAARAAVMHIKEE